MSEIKTNYIEVMLPVLPLRGIVGFPAVQMNIEIARPSSLKAFTAAVIGGIGSIPGAMIGGILLGVIESISNSIPALAPYTDAVEFAILIVLLLVRPSGIIGKVRREKV